MAMPNPKSARLEAMRKAREDARPHFDVTRVAGRVYLDADGDQTPMEAAMLLIARDAGDGGGEWSFPHAVQGTVRVSINVTED